MLKIEIETERELIKLLHEYPEVIRDAGESLSPALVANYAYELAKGFNNFYQALPILKDVEPEVTAFRLSLSNETGKVVQSAMSLLGIELPDRM